MSQTIPNIDQHLLKRLSEDDRLAFEQLFYSHWDMVYSTALVMTKVPEMAGDIAQDVFLSLWENRQKAAVIENIKGFLYTSVKFLVHKRLRRIKVEDAYTQYLGHKSSKVGDTHEVESSVTTKQLQSSIRNSVAQLPPQWQLAFKLSREQGLTHEQIGEVMHISRKTVKDYIVRSMAYLRQHLAHYMKVIIVIGGGL
ncbi:MAG TPA: sigma-70 family RNA polymerase sigma factor [Agriterribacter sp.]|nr:sigma-70 family RNA polymerase sigma factor [Agriterribacter sp.]